MSHLQKCTACQEQKDLSFFHKLKSGKYGVSSWCKLCKSEYNKTRYAQNREEKLEKMKLYSKTEKARFNRKKYESDPIVREKIKKYDEFRRKRDRHKIIERMAIYNKKEHVVARAKKWSKKQEVIDRRRQYSSDRRKQVSDSYSKALIYKQSGGFLKSKDIPQELVELKKKTLKLKRLIKETKNEQ